VVHYKVTDPNKKLRELIVYIAQESEGDSFFGAVKLNKLLFNIDFVSFRRTGKSITGQAYQALENGPAPKRMLPVLTEMQRKGDLFLREDPFFGYTQKRPIALREAELSQFSSDEIVLIDRTIKRFWKMSATQISENSHEFVGWSLAERKEIIPYSVALLGRNDLSERQIKHANIVEKRARKWLESRAT
jgi:hypothetical protein